MHHSRTVCKQYSPTSHCRLPSSIILCWWNVRFVCNVDVVVCVSGGWLLVGVLHSSFATHFQLQQQQELVWVVRAASLFTLLWYLSTHSHMLYYRQMLTRWKLLSFQNMKYSHVQLTSHSYIQALSHHTATGYHTIHYYIIYLVLRKGKMAVDFLGVWMANLF